MNKGGAGSVGGAGGRPPRGRVSSERQEGRKARKAAQPGKGKAKQAGRQEGAEASVKAREVQAASPQTQLTERVETVKVMLKRLKSFEANFGVSTESMMAQAKELDSRLAGERATTNVTQVYVEKLHKQQAHLMASMDRVLSIVSANVGIWASGKVPDKVIAKDKNLRQFITAFQGVAAGKDVENNLTKTVRYGKLISKAVGAEELKPCFDDIIKITNDIHQAERLFALSIKNYRTSISAEAKQVKAQGHNMEGIREMLRTEGLSKRESVDKANAAIAKFDEMKEKSHGIHLETAKEIDTKIVEILMTANGQKAEIVDELIGVKERAMTVIKAAMGLFVVAVGCFVAAAMLSNPVALAIGTSALLVGMVSAITAHVSESSFSNSAMAQIDIIDKSMNDQLHVINTVTVPMLLEKERTEAKQLKELKDSLMPELIKRQHTTIDELNAFKKATKVSRDAVVLFDLDAMEEFQATLGEFMGSIDLDDLSKPIPESVTKDLSVVAGKMEAATLDLFDATEGAFAL